MRKINNCSFYFILKSFIKKYFIFLFISVVFITNGLFVSVALANTTNISEDILTDTHWTKDGSPYVISSSISVGEDATLFIEEGVIVKFDSGSSLTIDGKIEAQGSSSLPIYFTSLFDDSVGGDTNNDGEDSAPNEGDWDYILIESPDSKSIMNNVIERYSNEGLILYNGGSVSSLNFDSDKGIMAFGSNSSFDNLSALSIDLYESSVFTINNSVLSNNGDVISIYNNSSLNLNNSKVEGVGNYFISIYDNSSAIFDTVQISGDSSIGVWGDSSLNISNSNITSSGDGFQIFQNSSLTATDLSMNCGNDGISVYNNSSLDLSGGTISCLDDGLLLFQEATANINEVKITDALDAGIIAFSNTGPSKITVTKSEITNNNYGFVVFNSLISVHQNNIHNNITNGALTFAPTIEGVDTVPIDLDFTSNFWGDVSGPTHPTNPSGIGDTISDNILYSPFLKSDPLKPSKDPVIIIPGVIGTEIFNGDEKLWLDLLHNLTDIGDQFMDVLQFKSDLTPSLDGLTVGDILRKETVDVGIGKISLFDYSYGLIQDFKNQGYTEGTDLFTFPYDWRYGVNDINISKLKQKISDVLTQTGKDKVDIIAHSTGGLLVKKYVMDYPTENHINKAIFVGVPNTGAPEAIKTFLEGSNFGNPFLANSEIKKIVINMPVIYDLSPSQQYFDIKGSFVEIIDDFFLHSDKKDLNFEQTSNFLIDDHKLNSQALENAQNLHTSDFDNYDLRTNGIDSYNIVGCKAGTSGKIIERRTHGLFGVDVEYDQPKSVPGDGTVPLESATNLPIDQDHKYFALKANHGKMLSQNGIRQQIINIISGSNLSTGNLITQDISQCKLNGRAIAVYSPLSIDILDQDNNHSGLSSDGVSIENNIPNASFEIMGDHKFVYLPDDNGQTYNISIKGTGNGIFTITDSKIVDNQTTSMQVFSNIPVTSSLTGSIILGDITKLVINGNNEEVIPTYVLDADHIQDFNPTHKEVIDNNHSSGGSLIIQPSTSSVFVEEKKNVENLPSIPIIKDNNPKKVASVSQKNQNLNQNLIKKENFSKDNNLLTSSASNKINIKYMILFVSFTGIFVLWLVKKIIKR